MLEAWVPITSRNFLISGEKNSAHSVLDHIPRTYPFGASVPSAGLYRFNLLVNLVTSSRHVSARVASACDSSVTSPLLVDVLPGKSFTISTMSRIPSSSLDTSWYSVAAPSWSFKALHTVLKASMAVMKSPGDDQCLYLLCMSRWKYLLRNQMGRSYCILKFMKSCKGVVKCQMHSRSEVGGWISIRLTHKAHLNLAHFCILCLMKSAQDHSQNGHFRLHTASNTYAQRWLES
jgi:hypothetical protein